jgi:hypothetical protein
MAARGLIWGERAAPSEKEMDGSNWVCHGRPAHGAHEGGQELASGVQREVGEEAERGLIAVGLALRNAHLLDRASDDDGGGGEAAGRQAAKCLDRSERGFAVAIARGRLCAKLGLVERERDECVQVCFKRLGGQRRAAVPTSRSNSKAGQTNSPANSNSSGASGAMASGGTRSRRSRTLLVEVL